MLVSRQAFDSASVGDKLTVLYLPKTDVRVLYKFCGLAAQFTAGGAKVQNLPPKTAARVKPAPSFQAPANKANLKTATASGQQVPHTTVPVHTPPAVHRPQPPIVHSSPQTQAVKSVSQVKASTPAPQPARPTPPDNVANQTTKAPAHSAPLNIQPLPKEDKIHPSPLQPQPASTPLAGTATEPPTASLEQAVKQLHDAVAMLKSQQPQAPSCKMKPHITPALESSPPPAAPTPPAPKVSAVVINSHSTKQATPQKFANPTPKLVVTPPQVIAAVPANLPESKRPESSPAAPQPHNVSQKPVQHGNHNIEPELLKPVRAAEVKGVLLVHFVGILGFFAAIGSLHGAMPSILFPWFLFVFLSWAASAVKVKGFAVSQLISALAGLYACLWLISPPYLAIFGAMLLAGWVICMAIVAMRKFAPNPERELITTGKAAVATVIAVSDPKTKGDAVITYNYCDENNDSWAFQVRMHAGRPPLKAGDTFTVLYDPSSKHNVPYQLSKFRAV